MVEARVIAQRAHNKVTENDATIQIVSYDPRWAQLFNEERDLLLSVLAQWLVGPIEHIGSTAVHGLAAKPVIDIMAAVASLDESRDAIEAARLVGYQYAPYHADMMHWFCKPRPSHRTHHLHLVPYQSELWAARIKFRDRLRADQRVAAEYADLKQSLCVSFPADREAYTEGKSGFINRIVRDTQPEE